MIMIIFGRCSLYSSCYTESNECADYENMSDDPRWIDPRWIDAILGKDECSY